MPQLHTFAACSYSHINIMLMTLLLYCLNLLFLLLSERPDTLSSNIYSLQADYC